MSLASCQLLHPASNAQLLYGFFLKVSTHNLENLGASRSNAYEAYDAQESYEAYQPKEAYDVQEAYEAHEAHQSLPIRGKTKKGPVFDPFRTTQMIIIVALPNQLDAATWSKMSVTALSGSLPARETITATTKPQMKPGIIS